MIPRAVASVSLPPQIHSPAGSNSSHQWAFRRIAIYRRPAPYPRNPSISRSTASPRSSFRQSVAIKTDELAMMRCSMRRAGLPMAGNQRKGGDYQKTHGESENKSAAALNLPSLSVRERCRSRCKKATSSIFTHQYSAFPPSFLGNGRAMILWAVREPLPSYSDHRRTKAGVKLATGGIWQAGYAQPGARHRQETQMVCERAENCLNRVLQPISFPLRPDDSLCPQP